MGQVKTNNETKKISSENKVCLEKLLKIAELVSKLYSSDKILSGELTTFKISIEKLYEEITYISGHIIYNFRIKKDEIDDIKKQKKILKKNDLLAKKNNVSTLHIECTNSQRKKTMCYSIKDDITEIVELIKLIRFGHDLIGGGNCHKRGTFNLPWVFHCCFTSRIKPWANDIFIAATELMVLMHTVLGNLGAAKQKCYLMLLAGTDTECSCENKYSFFDGPCFFFSQNISNKYPQKNTEHHVFNTLYECRPYKYFDPEGTTINTIRASMLPLFFLAPRNLSLSIYSLFIQEFDRCAGHPHDDSQVGNFNKKRHETLNNFSFIIKKAREDLAHSEEGEYESLQQHFVSIKKKITGKFSTCSLPLDQLDTAFRQSLFSMIGNKYSVAKKRHDIKIKFS